MVHCYSLTGIHEAWPSIIGANLRIWCEKGSIFDRIEGIKLLSTRQLKKIEKMDFCSYPPAQMIDLPNLSVEIRQAIVKMVRHIRR